MQCQYNICIINANTKSIKIYHTNIFLFTLSNPESSRQKMIFDRPLPIPTDSAANANMCIHQGTLIISLALTYCTEVHELTF